MFCCQWRAILSIITINNIIIDNNIINTTTTGDMRGVNEAADYDARRPRPSLCRQEDFPP